MYLPRNLINIHRTFRLNLLTNNRIPQILRRHPSNSLSQILHTFHHNTNLPNITPYNNSSLIRHINNPKSSIRTIRSTFNLQTPTRHTLISPPHPITNSRLSQLTLYKHRHLRRRIRRLPPTSIIRPSSTSPIIISSRNRMHITLPMTNLIRTSKARPIRRTQALLHSRIINSPSTCQSRTLPISTRRDQRHTSKHVRTRPHHLLFRVTHMHTLTSNPQRRHSNRTIVNTYRTQQHMLRRRPNAPSIGIAPPTRTRAIMQPTVLPTSNTPTRILHMQTRQSSSSIPSAQVLLSTQRANRSIHKRVRRTLRHTN